MSGQNVARRDVIHIEYGDAVYFRGANPVFPLYRSCRKILLGCLAFLLIAPLSAKTPYGELRFDRITPANGLNAAFSTAIGQDSQGYMWFGSQTGLLRYDGFHSKKYKSCVPESRGTDSDYIYSLFTDDLQRMWAGTDQGICLYDPERDMFIRYLADSTLFADVANAPITKIVSDGNGSLWLASNIGLIHFFPEDGHFALVSFPEEIRQSFDGKDGTALERDGQGNLWFGSKAGLYLLKPDATKFEQVRLDNPAHPDMRHNQIVALKVDLKQTLWIGTRSGLEILQTNTPDLLHHRANSSPELKNAWITDLTEDNQSDMWIATHNDGVFRWDRQTGVFQGYRHDPLELRSIVGDELDALFQDRTGTLWIGTLIDGVSKVELSSGDFRHISQDTRAGKGLVDNKIKAIVERGDGVLFLNTLSGGFSSYDPKTLAVKKVDIKSEFVNTSDAYTATVYKPVAADGKDKVWMVTESGMRHFNLVTESFDLAAPTLGAPDTARISMISVDKDGTLWVLTADALYRLVKNKAGWQRYQNRAPVSLARNADPFKAMFDDSHGKFWVTTLNNIYVFDKATEQFTHFADRPHVLDGHLGSLMVVLFVDSKGRIWLDNEGGLSKLEVSPDGVRNIRNFATSTMVDSVVEDLWGTVWISTDDGVARFDQEASEFRHYHSLEDDAIAGYFVGSAMRSANGAIYFGGPHGVVEFRPDQLSVRRRLPPPVLITDFQIFNKSVAVASKDNESILKTTIQTTKALTLSYLDSVFSIEFAALDFANPLANQYAYKLQGFDNDWRYTDATRRLATYTNLNPGHYTFHVKAANTDGVWNDTGAQLEITITPPFWRTWWFDLLAILALLGGLFAMYQNRIRRFVRQNEALERLVLQRTQEIVQQKDVIESKNKQLEAVNQMQEEHQSELTHFLAVASHDLRQPIHALNIYLGALTELDVKESARTVFDKMRKCVQNMDEMFLSLLDLTLLEANAVRPRIEHFSIATILSLIDVEFTPQAQARGLTFTVEPCAEWIDSDANLIKQILANLTANAVRYTKAGSITLHCEKMETCLRVSVQDTGIGISPSQQSMVFKKFHQLNNADREKAKGIGLGLAIVKRLCELLELPLHLNSVPGKGSTFTIDLPLSRNQSNDLANVSGSTHFASQVSLANVLVVVIDDDEMILDAMRGLLEKWGCAITTASCGKDAIAMFGTSSRAPDVLICDYRLHVNEDGFDTINMLRNEFNQEIPALLITGDASSDIIRDRDVSNIHVMHKPVIAEQLREALVNVLYPEAAHFQEEIDSNAQQ